LPLFLISQARSQQALKSAGIFADNTTNVIAHVSQREASKTSLTEVRELLHAFSQEIIATNNTASEP
jgi:hypothetical protein